MTRSRDHPYLARIRRRADVLAQDVLKPADLPAGLIEFGVDAFGAGEDLHVARLGGVARGLDLAQQLLWRERRGVKRIRGR
jgi:hypothetical protein